MVDLVLQDARVVSGGLEGDAFPRAVQRLHADRLETWHPSAEKKRNREAALRILFRLFANRFVARVEERRQRDRRLLALADLRLDLVKERSQGSSDLRLGDSSPYVLPHRVFEI